MRHTVRHRICDLIDQIEKRARERNLRKSFPSSWINFLRLLEIMATYFQFFTQKLFLEMRNWIFAYVGFHCYRHLLMAVKKLIKSLLNSCWYIMAIAVVLRCLRTQMAFAKCVRSLLLQIIYNNNLTYMHINLLICALFISNLKILFTFERHCARNVLFLPPASR